MTKFCPFAYDVKMLPAMPPQMPAGIELPGGAMPTSQIAHVASMGPCLRAGCHFWDVDIKHCKLIVALDKYISDAGDHQPMPDEEGEVPTDA